MSRGMLAAALACSLSSTSPTLAASRVTVMSQNQYLGADFAALASPTSDLNTALVSILQAIAATDFQARAWRQAEEIALLRPDLVALEESWLLQCVDLDGPGLACGQPSIAPAFQDYLKVTLAALAALRQDYQAVAEVEDLDLRTAELTPPSGPPIALGGLPFVIDGHRALLVVLDRDVILARRDTVSQVAPVDFGGACLRSADGCHYHMVLPVSLTTPQGVISLAFQRGFTAVDATVSGNRLRFVATHFEVKEPQAGNPLSGLFQAAQAAELIQILQTTPVGRFLIVAGDTNSSPKDPVIPAQPQAPPPFNQEIVPPYKQFIATGYKDSWLLWPATASRPGFTCCQAEDLRNQRSTLDQRIDMVFTHGKPSFGWDLLVGNTPFSKTRSGLWPSDHAGLASALFLGPHSEASR